MDEQNKLIEGKCVDLIVLGISYTSTEKDVKKYFNKLGDVDHVDVSINY